MADDVLGERGQLRFLLVVVAAALTGVLGFNLPFKEYVGYYIEGNVLMTLKRASLIQCANACLNNQPQCRAFNVIYSGTVRPSREYTCEVLSSYNNLHILAYKTLYYKPDMYQDLGYNRSLDRLVYYVPPVKSLPWSIAQWKCKNLWGELLVPRTEAEYEWMKGVYINMAYEAMWLPILELGERDTNDSHYVWTGWNLNSTAAPGSLQMNWTDDNVTVMCPGYDGTTFTCDTVDCALFTSSTAGSNDFHIVIQECFNASFYDTQKIGYICEAAIPDPATYPWLNPPTYPWNHPEL
ncbi:uncharacterized protein [Procambarus clarkii]|uniref:uncharacterized protein n=1 Tax=Procambarus clarkii TaxID=6728 RepID=UPI001E6738D7|nr:uncharacterized protein LOC123768753 [Procambarus clarkii]